MRKKLRRGSVCRLKGSLCLWLIDDVAFVVQFVLLLQVWGFA